MKASEAISRLTGSVTKALRDFKEVMLQRLAAIEAGHRDLRAEHNLLKEKVAEPRKAEPIEIKLEAGELQRVLKECIEACEEKNAELLQGLESRIKAFEDAAVAREFKQSEILAEMRTLFSTINKAAPMETVVRSVVDQLRTADTALVTQCVELARKELLVIEPLVARLGEVETRLSGLPSALELANETAKLIPIPKQGAPGKDGRDGVDGKDGAPGKDGRDGVDGKDGAPGKDGRDGVDGKDGAPGERGADGRNGVDGKDGAPGERGIPGEKGADGVAGKDGRDGVDGKDGAPGERGIPGEKGADGAPGERGADGRDGVDGKDGAPGERGVPGEKGIDGAPGKDGRDGVDGKEGPVGKDGAPGKDGRGGVDGINGRDGAPGADGNDGRDGVNGKDGAPGKDGESFTLEQAQAVIKAAIDSFPKPTSEEVAALITGKHMSEWALNFERRAQDLLHSIAAQFPKPKDGRDGMGFDDLAVEHDGERTFKFVLLRGEQRKEFVFKVDAMIYRGIFNEQHKYERGDTATWGGSTWIAIKDAPTGTPGRSTDWQLMVKKGRDGTSK